MLLDLVKKKPVSLSWIPGLIYVSAFATGTIYNLSLNGTKGFIFGINIWQNFFSYLIAYLFIASFEFVLFRKYKVLLTFIPLYVAVFSISYFIQFLLADNPIFFSFAEICLAPWGIILIIRNIVLYRFDNIFKTYLIGIFFMLISVVFNCWAFSVLGQNRTYIYLIDLLISPGLFYLLVNISDNIRLRGDLKDDTIYKLFSKDYRIRRGEFIFRAFLYLYIFLIALDNIFRADFRSVNNLDTSIRYIISFIITIVFTYVIINLFLMRFNMIRYSNKQPR
ncbi:MAG: hypothetical protein NVV82_22675 [Sporocytophaga sp.]|nr:hypothetical protein [Sporocytophaga sp.]